MKRKKQVAGILAGVAVAAALAGTALRACAAEATEGCAVEAAAGRLEACREALRDAPGDVTLRRHLARGLLIRGNHADSLAAYEAIARDHPDDAVTQYDYAMALVTLRHFEEGARALARTIAIDPDFRDAQFAASMVFAQMGWRARSFAATRRAAELGEDLAMFELAEAYRVGYGTAVDEGEALRWFRAAADGGHVTAMERLADAYLHGYYGLARDEVAAGEWADRARRQREQPPPAE